MRRNLPQHRKHGRPAGQSPAVRAVETWPRLLAAATAILLLIGFCFELKTTTAQEEEMLVASREYRIKAAYIYQFGRYVEWPEKAFHNANSPFVIGVMADDPIAGNLEQIARIKKIQDRPIQIRKFSSVKEIRPCHILYLSTLVPMETQAEILRKMSRQGVLTVGEASGFLEGGGTIQFVIKDNKVLVYVARKAAEQEGLAISAKLLQVANVVD